MKYLYSFILFLFFFAPVVNAEEVNVEKQCLDLLKGALVENSVNFDFPDYIKFETEASVLNISTDFLTGLYFDEKKFELKSFNGGSDHSELTKGEIMPPYTLFDSGSADSYLFDEGISTLKNQENAILVHCTYRDFDFIEGKNIKNLDKNSLGIIDTPTIFEIEAIEQDGISYKKVYTESLMRDGAQKPLATIKTFTFVPHLLENESFYTPYTLIDKKQQLWGEFFKMTGIDYYNSDLLQNLEVVYEDETIKVEVADRLSTGVEPTFVNGVLFPCNHFFHWNKHNLFMEMLRSNQAWASNVITISDKMVDNSWPEDSLTMLDWVLFVLKNKPIDIQKVSVDPYYQDYMHIARNEYLIWIQSTKDSDVEGTEGGEEVEGAEGIEEIERTEEVEGIEGTEKVKGIGEAEYDVIGERIFRRFLYLFFYDREEYDFEFIKVNLLRQHEAQYPDFEEFYKASMELYEREGTYKTREELTKAASNDATNVNKVEGERANAMSEDVSLFGKEKPGGISKAFVSNYISNNRSAFLIILGGVLILLALALKKTSFKD